jgi:hypothetical protein
MTSILVLVIGCSILLAEPVTRARGATDCVLAGRAAEHGVLVGGYCQPVAAGSRTQQTPAPQTKTVFCGRPSSGANGLWNPVCGTPRACFKLNRATGAHVPVDAFATLTRVGGRWGNPTVWCPAAGLPALNVTALRDRAIRLLPHVAIGSAWKTVALVNAETILWAATDAERSLGAVSMFGRQVRLRIAFERARWSFGDGTADTRPEPGKPYDEANNPCRTPQCPDYYGHTYRQAGRMTITLAVDWRAQFSLGGGAWIDIDGAITGPAERHTIDVEQTRAILVPNPGQH